VGRSGYQCPTEEVRRCSLAPQSCINRRYRQPGGIDETIKTKHFAKARVRAKFEYAIWVVKRVFDFPKVRYRGLARILHDHNARLPVTARGTARCVSCSGIMRHGRPTDESRPQ
jgi:hypothetical protein